MDEDFFKTGKLFDEYASSSDFEEVYRSTSLTEEDEAFFSSFTLKVLVISEKWCGDCRREVPLLAHIANTAGWDLRIFGREENPALMDEYATEGKKIIPVFVFFDEDFEEIGRFIERAPPGKTTLEVLREILGTLR